MFYTAFCRDTKRRFMRNDILKQLALKAKNRLIHNTDDKQEEKDLRIKVISSNDDIFYNKVKHILEDNIDTINPIKTLMDESLMSNMSNVEKEKYLLETVEKYQRIKNLIECEKRVKLVY